jgi:hypothetical protein
MELKRQAIEAVSGRSAEDVVAGLWGIADDKTASNGDKTRCYELLGRHYGLFAQDNTQQGH